MKKFILTTALVLSVSIPAFALDFTELNSKSIQDVIDEVKHHNGKNKDAMVEVNLHTNSGVVTGIVLDSEDSVVLLACGNRSTGLCYVPLRQVDYLSLNPTDSLVEQLK